MISRRFRFVSFGSRAPDGAAACDGLVDGAALDLSHWQRNRTPAELKRDTSVEIALAFARAEPNADIRQIVNNHFDADGVLAVWTLLSPERAIEHAGLITAAAEAGDFDEWPSDERGIWLELAIAELSRGLTDRAAYERVLGELDSLVTQIASRPELWRRGFESLLEAQRRAEQGALSVSAFGSIAIFEHAPGVSELPGPLLTKLAPAGAQRWLLSFASESGRFTYRYELPRWAWADTVRRPKLRPPSRNAISKDLGSGWALKGGLGMTGLLRTTEPVTLEPFEVARRIAAHERFVSI